MTESSEQAVGLPVADEAVDAARALGEDGALAVDATSWCRSCVAPTSCITSMTLPSWPTPSTTS